MKEPLAFPLKREPIKRMAIVDLWNQGYRTQAIAERVELSSQSVEQCVRVLRRDYGVELRRWRREDSR